MKPYRSRILFYAIELACLLLLIAIDFKPAIPAVVTHLCLSLTDSLFFSFISRRLWLAHDASRLNATPLFLSIFAVGGALCLAYAASGTSALMFFGVALMLLSMQAIAAQSDFNRSLARI